MVSNYYNIYTMIGDAQHKYYNNYYYASCKHIILGARKPVLLKNMESAVLPCAKKYYNIFGWQEV